MEYRYRHRQIGWLLLLVLGGAAVVCFIWAASRELAAFPLIAAAIFVFLGAIFSSVTSVVTKDRVYAWLGPGLFIRSYALADIVEARTVTNAGQFGWGWRLWPSGSMYNVSGTKAVELRLANGRAFGIGTDQPDELRRAIESAKAGEEIEEPAEQPKLPTRGGKGGGRRGRR